MYLKSIVIDGFKSYANRTTISDFDSHFNAITGLNGSGKSNILDAICFVLGITNVSTLRASTLRDLIYKAGTAGVNSASVSLVFNNEDKTNSPSGYEDLSEITITRQINSNGKSKYTINNTKAQPKRVATLFCSVQLDVNNPHFLIMQGRITKLLNMKPREILGLIESTLGTITYDSKKTEVFRIIDKKETTLVEINSMLSKDIGPAMDRLKEKKLAYEKLLKVEQEIQNVESHRELVLFRKYNIELETRKNELKCICEKIQKNLSDIERFKNDQSVQKPRNDQTLLIEENSERIKEIELSLKSSRKINAQLKSNLMAAETKLEYHINQIEQVRKQIEQTQKEINTNSDEYEKLSTDLKQNPLESICAKIEDLRKKATDSTSDLIIDEDSGKAVSRNEFILNIKAIISKYESMLMDARSEHKKAQLELEAIDRHVDRTDKNECANIQKELNSLKTSQKQTESMIENLKNTDTELDKLNRECTDLKLKLESDYLYFRYSDPCEGFDRSKVIGQLGCLFSCKNEQKYAKAIETAIGISRLRNIVVDKV